MELYTLGSGHYTFQDVKEASRAFTGRRFDHVNYPYAMYIDKNAFDNNYKTILGQTGNWDGNDVIDIILSQYQTARHISRSAIIFFLGQLPPEPIVDECAKVYFESGYIFKTLLKHIFYSPWSRQSILFLLVESIYFIHSSRGHIFYATYSRQYIFFILVEAIYFISPTRGNLFYATFLR